MTVKEMYSILNENYEDVIGRVINEVILKKVLKLFLSDTNMSLLEDGIKNENAKQAFAAVHTIKGTSLNLGFNALAKKASNMTELLRNKDEISTEAKEYLKEIQEEYNKVIGLISQIEL